MPSFTSIQLTGIDNVQKRRREGHVVLYGYRSKDVARRCVGIALNERDAQDVMDKARYIGTMPEVEIEDHYWFYVAALGDVLMESGKEPIA